MKKLFTFVICPIFIAVLLYLCINSIRRPLVFNKEVGAREKVGIDRLKDIRALQNAYKTKYNAFAGEIDTLIKFYHEDSIIVVKQVGSMDDSLAVAQGLVYRENQTFAVKDTLFRNKGEFNIDSLRYIPFSGKTPIIMKSVVKRVSGVQVPLFEAQMPYDDLLQGLERQLIVNLKFEKTSLNRYPGLMVGSISAPNNNAGNWE